MDYSIDNIRNTKSKGLHSPHEGLAGGSGQAMSGLAYYQPEHPASTGVVKYPENGHDTLSDFVTFVCQEAENTQQLPQVASGSFSF
ncbi:nuclear factor 1 A-type-like isoform X3 [Apis mellifera carnica]|nr:nuclear factor 1 A-type-like isoform X3 [Apis mellifera carnica]